MADKISFTEIDQNSLDTEWVKHAKLMEKYARLLADAKFEHARKKARCELVEAELIRDIGLSPMDYSLPPKTSETAKKNCVIYQQKFQKFERAMIEAKHLVDVLQAAVDTLEHRKATLENLSRLWAQSYFSTPKGPKDEDDDSRFEREKSSRKASFTRRRSDG